MLLSDIFFPLKEKEKNQRIINQHTDALDKKIKLLEPLIRHLRKHIDYIGHPDKFVAAYLLIGKSCMSLKASLLLDKHGFSYQMVEIVRSSIESLNLASLFLEDEKDKYVKQWFEGKIIRNEVARDELGKAINAMNKALEREAVPMKAALSDIYSIYSEYTHSGYSALFDYIDVFKEDFDFKQYSQFHYGKQYLHLINNLYVNVLLGLKNFYERANDEDYLAKVEELLSFEGNSFANPGEIGKEMERYE